MAFISTGSVDRSAERRTTEVVEKKSRRQSFFLGEFVAEERGIRYAANERGLAVIWALLILVGLGLVLLASAVGNSTSPPGWSDFVPLLYALGGLIVGIFLIYYGRILRK